MNGCIQIEGIDNGGIKDEVEDSQPPLFGLSADTVQCMLVVKSVNTTYCSNITELDTFTPEVFLGEKEREVKTRLPLTNTIQTETEIVTKSGLTRQKKFGCRQS